MNGSSSAVENSVTGRVGRCRTGSPQITMGRMVIGTGYGIARTRSIIAGSGFRWAGWRESLFSEP